MNAPVNINALDVGYDIPAKPGMDEKDIQTPCLSLDLDALERNIKKMGDYAKAHGMRHRSHGKMHKSVDVQKLQENLGGAIGVCCRRLARPRSSFGAASRMSSSPIRSATPSKDRPAGDNCRSSARTSSSAWTMWTTWPNCRRRQGARHQSVTLRVIDCGAGRCGVTTTEAVVKIAKTIDAAEGLTFKGIQAYQGAMQHLDSYADRKAKLDTAIAMVKDAVEGLKKVGLEPELVSGRRHWSFSIISKVIQEFTTSSSAGTLYASWMPITGVSTTRTASGSIRGNGKMRSSS